jgi:hypothetical protein
MTSSPTSNGSFTRRRAPTSERSNGAAITFRPFFGSFLRQVTVTVARADRRGKRRDFLFDRLILGMSHFHVVALLSISLLLFVGN